MPRIRSMYRRRATRSSRVKWSATADRAVSVAISRLLASRKRGLRPVPVGLSAGSPRRSTPEVTRPSAQTPLARSPVTSPVVDSVWWSRLRWRLRGAWMWPAFVGLTVFDGLLLHARPIAGDSMSVVEGLLLGCFFTLVAVAVVAPLIGALLRRRRRPDLPRIVAHDYAGT